MRSFLALVAIATLTSAKPNGFYHQEYNYQTSSSSYKNRELQHRNDDKGFYSQDGDLEGRLRPRVNSHSEHSEYVNPNLRQGYTGGVVPDRRASFGQLYAQNQFRPGEPPFNPEIEHAGRYGYVGHNQGVQVNLRQICTNLQQELANEMQRAVYDHYRRAAAYTNHVSQAQAEADWRTLQEEVRRNMTMRLQETLKTHFGEQGIRGGYSYTILNGRLQPVANYHNQELAELTRQMEESLMRQLHQQVQTYYHTTINTEVHTRRDTYRRVDGNYPAPIQERPIIYQPHPQPVQPVHPVQPVQPIHIPVHVPDSITTIATRVQTNLNEHLNRILEDTQKRYFTPEGYRLHAGVNIDSILARLQEELRTNITVLFDDQLRRAYYGDYTSKYSIEDVENLRRQIETNLLTKLNRDFNRQRENFLQTHITHVSPMTPIYQPHPIPGNMYYPPPNTFQQQQDLSAIRQQMQENLSRQLQTALMQHSYRQAHMYSNGANFNAQANYQATLDQLTAELNRNLTRQMEQFYAGPNQGAYAVQLANMKNQLQQDLTRQLQQGLQQSYSRYSSWSSSSSSHSGNYRPVRGFDPNLYRNYGASDPVMTEDCMMGDDPSTYQQHDDQDLTQQVQTLDNQDLTQQTEDLTQQIQSHDDLTRQTEDLTQQVQSHDDLTQQAEDLIQQERTHGDLTQQVQTLDDLTQQSEDLTQQVQTHDDLTQQSEDFTQQTQTLDDFTQQSEDLTQQTQTHDDLTQQSEDLTQQVQTHDDLTQQSEDLTQQVQTHDDLTQQSEDLTQQVQTHDNLSQQSQDLTQQVQTHDDLSQQSQDLTQAQSHDDLTQQSEDLTQQVQTHDDLSQQPQDLTQQVQNHDDLTQQVENLNRPGQYDRNLNQGQRPVVPSQYNYRQRYHAQQYTPSQTSYTSTYTWKPQRERDQYYNESVRDKVRYYEGRNGPTNQQTQTFNQYQTPDQQPSQQNHVLGQEIDDSDLTQQQTGKLEQLGQETDDSDLTQQTQQLGQETEDLGRPQRAPDSLGQTADPGFSSHTHTVPVYWRPQTKGIQHPPPRYTTYQQYQQNQGLTQQTENTGFYRPQNQPGQRTEDLGQQTQNVDLQQSQVGQRDPNLTPQTQWNRYPQNQDIRDPGFGSPNGYISKTQDVDHINPDPGFSRPGYRPIYVNPDPGFSRPVYKPNYINPDPGFSQPVYKPHYVNPDPGFTRPVYKPNYVNPDFGLNRPVQYPPSRDLTQQTQVVGPDPSFSRQPPNPLGQQTQEPSIPQQSQTQLGDSNFVPSNPIITPQFPELTRHTQDSVKPQQPQTQVGQKIDEDDLRALEPGLEPLRPKQIDHQNQLGQEIDGSDLTQQTQDVYKPQVWNQLGQDVDDSDLTNQQNLDVGKLQYQNQLGQQTDDFLTQQIQTDRSDLTQQTQDLGKLQEQNQLGQQTDDSDLTQQVDNQLGQQTDDSDLIQQTQDLGKLQNQNQLGQQTDDSDLTQQVQNQLGQQIEDSDLTQQTQDLGKLQNQNQLGQQTDDSDLTQIVQNQLGQQTDDSDLAQVPVEPQQNLGQIQQTQKPLPLAPGLPQPPRDYSPLEAETFDNFGQTQDLTQQTQNIDQPIEPQIATNKINKDEPFGREINANQQVDGGVNQQQLTEAQRQSQDLLDLLRDKVQENQQPQPLKPMQYQPRPVYGDFQGQQIPVGTTRQINHANPQEEQVEAQTVRAIEPVEPQIANQVYQVGIKTRPRPTNIYQGPVAPPADVVEVVTTTTTTERPGFWSRLGSNIKNKARQLKEKVW